MVNLIRRAARVAAIFCVSVLAVNCGRVSGTPDSAEGSWQMQVASFGCPVLEGVLTSPEVFRLVSDDEGSPFLGVSTTGGFEDSAGNKVRFEGSYFNGYLSGKMTILTPEGRVVVAELALKWVKAGDNAEIPGVLIGDITVVSDTEGACVGATASVTLTPRFASSDPAEVFEQCGPVDIVFVMDTSGSMDDEGQALCDQIEGLVQRLSDLGLTDVRVFKWGITEDAEDDSDFPCLTDKVIDVFNHPAVPGMPGRDFDQSEDWGAATAVVAELGASGDFSFAWREGALRILIPISDEGPSEGDPSESEEDTAVIVNAIAVAQEHEVIVSPIIGTGAETFVSEHARDLALGTGGVAVRSTDPDLDLGSLIFDIVFISCGGVVPPVEEPASPGPTILIAADVNSGGLYLIHAVTGATSNIGTMFIDQPSNVLYGVSSMFFNESTNSLWAGTGGKALSRASIYDVGSDLVATFKANNDDEASAHPGLAQRRTDGLILGFRGDVTGDLLAVSPTSGVAVKYADDVPGDVAFRGVGITFVDQRCYVAAGIDLLEIDPFSGTPKSQKRISLIGFPTGDGQIEGFDILSMTTRPSDDKVFAILRSTAGQGDSRPRFLCSINVGTATATNIEALTMPLDGLTWVPADYLSPER
jgi:hypothetical protein